MNSSETAPVFRSRREMRAAGAYQSTPDAAAPAAPIALVEPAAGPTVLTPIDGIAALFPLLGSVEGPIESSATALAAPAVSVTEPVAPALSAFDAILAAAPVPASPLPTTPAPATATIRVIPAAAPAAAAARATGSTTAAVDELSTAAMAVSDIAAELAAPIAPVVIHQEPIARVTPADIQPTPVRAEVLAPPVPVAPADTSREAEQLDVASIFGFAASGSSASTAATDRLVPVASERGKRLRKQANPRKQAKQKRARRGHPDAQARSAAKAAAAADRKTIRQRITGLGVMVLVGGLFAVLAIPAYADNNASSLAAATQIRTQKLDVSAAEATTTTATVNRDGYTATSAADLKQLYSNAIRQQNLAAYMQSGAEAAGDDYPWYAELSRNQGGGLSPLNYYYRECVDFVAWRLNRDQGSTQAPFKWVWSTLTPNGGNASQWKSAWINHGWPTGATPKVGAVAWFTYNHVGYVSGILNDGSVLIEEYNWEGNHQYSTRVIAPTDAYYLYAPPA